MWYNIRSNFRERRERMKFGEKLKSLRKEKNMTQADLAAVLGISTRTVQNYESGNLYPKNSEIYGKISNIFGVTADYLLDESDFEVTDKFKNGKTASKEDIDEIISNVSALFAGGTVTEADKDRVIAALTKAYWDSKMLGN